ncbi:MAG: hypothetical protein FJZ47_12745 [Candidatus Tectomicrobia bacterium]|uniref:Uncharacterized protein n=1 Tax=Tectimicrobiota bacterium TaxID=2528274 RepID=A0A938B2W4_UNCTE|nr:hypothetical protein [Candidatus Tectomicrobia bacterium]
MLRASRLVYPGRPSGPPPLWEWQQPFIDRLWWNAQTFGRWVDQRDFETWEALARENTRLWDTAYAPRVLYEPWPTWLAWLAEYRALLGTMQEVYGSAYDRNRKLGEGAEALWRNDRFYWAKFCVSICGLRPPETAQKKGKSDVFLPMRPRIMV